MKKEVSFDNYIAMCDRYDEAQFKCGDWWPSVLDIKTKIEPKVEQNLEFLIWIAETADAPKNQAQRESKEYINKLLNKTLVFIDNAEDDTQGTTDDIDNIEEDEEDDEEVEEE